jgi:hypothetical protein
MTAVTTAPPVTKRGGAQSKKAVPLGAVPRVSLMPPELGERTKQLGVQRSLRMLIVVVIAVTLVAVGGAWYLSFSAANALAEERHRTDQLLAEQQSYADVQQIVGAVEVGEAALRVGGSTEIDWQDYLARVQASLPEGVKLNSFSVEASTVTQQYPQASVPLQGARIATLQFTATSPSLPEIPDWLNRLRELPGFVDAEPGSVSLSEGGYQVAIEMHIDAQAYTNRLTAEEKDGDTATSDAGTDEGSDK